MKALGPLLSTKAGSCMHTHSRCTLKHTNNKHFQQMNPAVENIHLSFCLHFLLAAQHLNPYTAVGKSTTGWVLVGSQALLPLPRATRPNATLPEDCCGRGSCTLHPNGVLGGLAGPITCCPGSRSAQHRNLIIVLCHDLACSGCTHSFLPVF